MILVLSLAIAATSVGCAFGEIRPDDVFQRQYSLEEMQKRYTDLVRWSKFDEAAGFMEEENRQIFVQAMPDFKDVRFSDYEVLPWELEDDEMRHATIEVTYTGYSMRVPIEIEIHETQTWTRTGRGNHWTVESSFIDLEDLAGSPRS
jgi:hypothetical protein